MMKPLSEIRTPEELAQGIEQSTEKVYTMRAIVAQKTVRLNLLEEINRTLEQEVDFRSLRVASALDSNRNNFESLIIEGDEIDAIGHQLESDSAMMEKIDNKLATLRHGENLVFNHQTLADILSLTQRKHVKR